MKKALALMLALLMMLTVLASCSKTEPTKTEEPAKTETPAKTEEPAKTETPAKTEEPAKTDDKKDEPAKTEPAKTEEPPAPTETAHKPDDTSYFPLCEPGAVTLTYMAGTQGTASQVTQLMEPDFSQNTFFNWLMDLTGVQIKFEILDSSSAFRERFNLMLVAEDYPDIAVSQPNQVSSSPDMAYEDGVIIRLNDYMDLIPNYLMQLDASTGGYGGALTDGGNLLGFWQLRDRTQPSFLGYYTRRDWMEDLGLELPTTIDGWTTMLEAFRDNKTNGSGPLLMANNVAPFANWICRAWNINTQSNNMYMIQKDGHVECSALSDGFRDYLQQMSDWYNDKLIIQDFAGITAQDAATNLLADNEIGVWLGMFRMGGTFYHDVYGICEDTFYAQKLVHPTLEKGGTNMIGDRGVLPSAMGMMGAMIFADCEHIEEAVQFLDYIYSTEGTLRANWGWEGETFEYGEDGKPHFMAWMSDPERSTNKDLYLIHSRPKMDLMDTIEDGYGPDALDYYDVWNDVGQWNMPGVTFSQEEGEVRSALESDISTYVSEFMVKVVAGQQELNDKTWNEFKDNLKAMKIDDVTAVWQTALDRFLKKIGS